MNDDALLKQIMRDKERTAAWAWRAVIMLISALGAIAMWLGETELHQLWYGVDQISQKQTTNAVSIAKLNEDIQNHIASETELLGEVKNEESDHEQRIRTLEHGSVH